MENMLRAVENGDLERVRSILDTPSNAVPEKHLKYVLAHAAGNGQPHIVSFFLDRGLELQEDLPASASNGHSVAVWQVLLDHGWDINAPCCRFGGPALSLVVDDATVTTWFLDHGADPNLRKDRLDVCPLDSAAGTLDVAVVGLLLDRGADLGQSNALHAAAKRADGIPMMAYLLDRGFDINALEHQANPTYFETFKQLGHKTALQIVARKGRIGHVRFLLDRGADRTIKDSRGCTAADWARSCNHPECYELVKVDD